MRLFCASLLSLILLTGCDLGDPQQMQATMESKLRPYFPNTKAFAQQGVLLGITCVDAGPELIRMVPSMMDSISELKQMKLLRFVPGSTSYKVVGIAFKRGYAWYNVATGTSGVSWGNAAYARAYDNQCAEIQSQNLQIPRPIYVGKFRVTVETPQGPQTQTTVESLGVFGTPAGFEAVKDSATERAAEFVKAQYENRGQVVLGIEFDSYQTQPMHLTADWTR